MNERSIGNYNRQRETKSVGYVDQIGAILADDHPLAKLESVSTNVDYFLDYNDSLQLKKDFDDPTKREGAVTKLIYDCLPTLNDLLQEVKELGIDEHDLVSVGFQKLIETIQVWQPREGVPKQVDYLKFHVNRTIREKLKEFIASEYKLSRPQFELVSLYIQARDKYEKIYEKMPGRNDWQILDEMIEESLRILPEEKKSEIQNLRYLNVNRKNFKQQRVVTIDILYEIHEKTVARVKDIFPTRDDVSLSAMEDLVSLKETMPKLLTLLDDKARKVVEMRYGFNDGDCHILKETGEAFHVSGECIRKTEKKALKKLDHDYKEFVLNIHSIE